MKKAKILSVLLAFSFVFTVFSVGASAKLERYDLASDQISYHNSALSEAGRIIDSVYGNTFPGYRDAENVSAYENFLYYATYYLRKEFVENPVEKCEYEIVLNDISEYNNGKAVHFTAISDIYTANSTEPTVKEMDIFIKLSPVYKLISVTDVYIAEKSLENLVSSEIFPMTIEKFLDWADNTNDAEYAALIEKLKPETEAVINHYERDIFKDVYHNQNENVVLKNTVPEAFELVKNFLNDYTSCINAKKELETDVPMASEYVHRYLNAMTKHNHSKYYGGELEIKLLDAYTYETDVYLEVQFIEDHSSDVAYFRFVEQDEGNYVLANFLTSYFNFDALVFDWNTYGDSFWLDSYIQDFKTIDYAQVIKRAERIAENGYFASDMATDLNVSVPADNPLTDPDFSDSPVVETDFLSNPATADIGLVFYALAIISAVLACINFKKRT